MNKVDQYSKRDITVESAASPIGGMGAIAEARQTVDRTRADLDASIARLEEEAGRLHALIDLHLEEITSLKKIRQAISGDATTEGTALPEMQFAPRKRERKRSQAWIVRQAAREILLERAHPLNSSELLSAMVTKGAIAEGCVGAKAVSKILWAAPEFSSTARGYWLADVPAPPTSTAPPKRKRGKRGSAAVGDI